MVRTASSRGRRLLAGVLTAGVVGSLATSGPADAAIDCDLNPTARICAGHEEPPSKPTRPPALSRNIALAADWAMSPRGEGPERPASTDAAEWRRYVNPTHWGVVLDACGSRIGSATNPNHVDSFTRFAWTIEGVGGVESASCRTTVLVPALGDYPVRLSASTSFGGSAETALVISPRDRLIVSIGDSAASGEGTPNSGQFGKRTAEWDMAQCHRSWNAAPKRAAAQINDPKVSTTFVPLACSGASIGSRGLLGSYRGIEPRGWLMPQVQAAAAYTRGRRVDTLLVSGGINDLGFSNVARFCVQFTKCWNRSVSKAAVRGVAKIDGLYARLDQEIHRHFPGRLPGQVLLTTYPDPTKSNNGSYCKSILSIGAGGRLEFTRSELKWADEEILRPLNRAISEAATQRHHRGWRVVDTYPSFAHHGYCASSSNRAFIQLSQSLAREFTFDNLLATQGSLHPNNKGQQMIADLITPALRTTPR